MKKLKLNFFSALASIAASLASAQLRLPEWSQVRGVNPIRICISIRIMINVKNKGQLLLRPRPLSPPPPPLPNCTFQNGHRCVHDIRL